VGEAAGTRLSVRALWWSARPIRSGPERVLVPVLCIAPLLGLILVFFVWPLIGSIAASFHPHLRQGGTSDIWTLDNYRVLASPFYFNVLLRTLRVSLVVTLISVVLAFPVAWFAAGLRPAAQAYFLMVYIAPWLVNVAVKAFGWSLLLGRNGIINRALRELGLIDAPLQLMMNETGVIVGLVHAHLIFVLLPLWATLNGLDPKLLWAGSSLGASGASLLRHIVLPLTLPALIAGGLINFTMNVAAFVTPALLGGSRVELMSYLVYRINLVDLNFELGAAIAMAMLVVTVSFVVASRRAGRGVGGAAP
jgi:putative spermidine/putrescine transport system permease protein